MVSLRFISRSIVVGLVFFIALIFLHPHSMVNEALAQKWLENNDRGVRSNPRAVSRDDKNFFDVFKVDRIKKRLPRKKKQRLKRVRRAPASYLPSFRFDGPRRGESPKAHRQRIERALRQQKRFNRENTKKLKRDVVVLPELKKRNDRERHSLSRSHKNKNLDASPHLKQERLLKPVKLIKPVFRKDRDAGVLVVIGDVWGQQVAKGLTDYYAREKGLIILSRAQENAGLVQNNHLSWLSQVEEIGRTTNIAGIVVALGYRDGLKSIVKGDQKFEPFSSDWVRLYKQKTRQLALALSTLNKPVFWLSTLPVQDQNLHVQQAQINRLFQQTLLSTPLRYIDAWSGFLDEGGQYSRIGLDLDGNSAPLRWRDGFRLTRAGRKKYAHYVGRFITLKDNSNTVISTGLGVAATPLFEGIAKNSKSQIGPIIPVNSSRFANAQGLVVERAQSFKSLTSSQKKEKKTFSIQKPAPKNRADNFEVISSF